VSLDTTLPNRLVRAALEGRTMEEFQNWDLKRAEAAVGRSRLDFILARKDGGRLALEVKSVTLVREGIAFFPDAVTSRGARHVRELTELAGRPDWEAAVLFVLQRSDAEEIRAALDLDPTFARTLEEARKAGVRILGRRCRVGLDSIRLGPPVPVGVG
jgi:sugar fermentation stimulation protein A